MRKVFYLTGDKELGVNVFDTATFKLESDVNYLNTLRYEAKSDTQNVNINISSIENSERIYLRKNSVKAIVDYSLSKRKFRYKDKNVEMYLSEKNAVHKVSGMLVLNNENIGIGIIGGLSGSTLFPDYESYKDNSYVQPISSVLEDNRLILGITSAFKYKKLYGDFEIRGEPEYVDLISVKSLQSGGINNMPLCIYNNRISYTLGAKFKNVTIEKKGSLNYYSSDTLSSSSDTLPFNVDFLDYKSSLNLTFRSFRGEIKYNKVSGDFYGKSQYFTYLKAPDISIRNIQYKVGYSSKKRNSVYLFGEYLKGDLPQGDVDMSPFSSWSILYPMAYRIKNGEFKFNDIGLLGRLKKQWGKINSTSVLLRGSFSRCFAGGYSSEKKIFVLIPLYVNEKKHELINMYGFTGKLELSHTINIGKNELKLNYDQWIPLWNEVSKNVSDNGSNSKTEASVFGGMSLGFSYSFSF